MNTTHLSEILQKEDNNYTLTYKLDTLGPYESVFHAENLSFKDDVGARGSSLFPFTSERYKNTEIFIEHPDILIACGIRWSLSWKKENILDIIHLPTGKKSRIYPEAVHLIYHDEDILYIYYTKEKQFYQNQVSLSSLEIISESSHAEIHAFFKLLYYPEEKKYRRIVLQSRWEKQYFEVQGFKIEENKENWVFPIHSQFSHSTEISDFSSQMLRLTDMYKSKYKVLDILYPETKKTWTLYYPPIEKFTQEKLLITPSNQCYRHSLQCIDRKKIKDRLYYYLWQNAWYLLIMTIVCVGFYGITWMLLIQGDIKVSEIQASLNTKNIFGIWLYIVFLLYIARLEYSMIKAIIGETKNLLQLRKGNLDIEVLHHEYTQEHRENNTLYFF